MSNPDSIESQTAAIETLSVQVSQVLDELESIRIELDRALRNCETTRIAYSIENGIGIPHPLNNIPVLQYCCKQPELIWYGDSDYPGVCCKSCGYVVAENGSVVFEPGELEIEEQRTPFL